VDRARQLDLRAGQVLTDADDLLRFTAGLRPAARALPAVDDVESYLVARLEPQLRWYTARAGELETKLTRVRHAQGGLSVLGVLLAAAAATLEVGAAAAWVGVVTTISAAVTAHAAGSRLEYQLVEYLRTAAQLDRLRTGWVAGGHDRPVGDALVRDCEQVISVQNEAWMAKWTGGDAATTGGG